MKALKWSGLGVGGLAALAAAIVAAAFLITSGAATAGGEFVKLVGESKYEEAYRSTAPEFRKETSLETFRALMQRFALDKAAAASWNSRAVSGGVATLEGTIKIRNGGAVAIKMQLVKSDGVWRVYGFSLRAAGTS